MRFYDAIAVVPGHPAGHRLVSVLGSGPISVAYALAFATVPTLRAEDGRGWDRARREMWSRARASGRAEAASAGATCCRMRSRHLLIRSVCRWFAVPGGSPTLTFLGGPRATAAVVGWQMNERRATYAPPMVRQILGPGVGLMLLGLNCLSDALRMRSTRGAVTLETIRHGVGSVNT